MMGNSKRGARQRLRQCLKDRRGMTLVELMVALVASAIVVAMAGGILISSMNMLSYSVTNQSDAALAEYVLDFVADTVEPAYGVQVVSRSDLSAARTADDGAMMLYVSDDGMSAKARGALWYRAASTPGSPPPDVEDLYGESFYGGRSIQLTFTIDADDAVPVLDDPDAATVRIIKAATVKVTVFDPDDRVCAERSRTFKMLNYKPAYEADPAGVYYSGQDQSAILKIWSS